MNDYLIHYGIKGQKWGVRRFQNEDRTWTEAGKKRYGSDSSDRSYSRKERRADNDKAYELGKKASIYGKAATKAMNLAAKRIAKADKAYAKDEAGLKKSTQRKREKAEQAMEAAKSIAATYKKYEHEVEAHHKELIKKYGAENVSDIKYKDQKISKKAAEGFGKDSVRIINERTNRLSDWARAGWLTMSSEALSVVLGANVSLVYSPTSTSDKANMVLNQELRRAAGKTERNYDLDVRTRGYRSVNGR